MLAVMLCCACVSPDAANRPPLANAGKDLRAVKFADDVYIQLDGSASHDPDGNSIEWRWDVARSPGALILAGDQRSSVAPIVGLGTTGLHIFRLTTRDLDGAESFDFVNVYVVDGLVIEEPPVPDFGMHPEDVGVDVDGGSDLGVEDPDAAPLDADVIPDAGPTPDAAPGVNRPPQPQIGAVTDRIDFGQQLQLNADDTEDESPETLDYRWQLLQGPPGVDFAFESSDTNIRLAPPAPGRYTLRLTVDDGEFERSTDRAFYVRQPQVWIFSAEVGRADARSREDGAPSASSVLFGALQSAATSFEARAGILYAAMRPIGNGAPSLAIAAPGAGLNRRTLQGSGRPGLVRAGYGGVWVNMQATPSLFFSDPTGRAPLNTLSMPAALTNGYGFAIDGHRGWMVNRSQPQAIIALDLASRAVIETLYGDDGLCDLLEIAVDGDQLYSSCRGQNAVLALPRNGDPVDRTDRISMAGTGNARAGKVLRLGELLVSTHRSETFVSIIPIPRFALAQDDPLRQRDALEQLNVLGEVLDIAGTADTVFVLSQTAPDSTRLTAFALPSGEQLWGRATGLRGATLLAVDAADDFSRDLGPL